MWSGCAWSPTWITLLCNATYQHFVIWGNSSYDMLILIMILIMVLLWVLPRGRFPKMFITLNTLFNSLDCSLITYIINKLFHNLTSNLTQSLFKYVDRVSMPHILYCMYYCPRVKFLKKVVCGSVLQWVVWPLLKLSVLSSSLWLGNCLCGTKHCFY